MALNFSTKAGTLSLLLNKLNTAKVLPLIYFTISNWKSNRVEIIKQVQLTLGKGPWIIRSSSKLEDNIDQSNAGAFLSLANIHINELESAVEQVISSYINVCNEDEVLIQPLLQNVIRSGVAFSHDPNTCSPYHVINWSEGADTTIVTSGMGGKTWQQAAQTLTKAPKGLESVILLIHELEDIFDNIPIDIEFAVTNENGEGNEIIWLLQVRKLILRKEPESSTKLTERLKLIEEKISRDMSTDPYLMGQRTVYGVMPDWNPAEMIGLRPKPLALSLYRELITDSIWAYQRHNYGYRNLRSYPLMPHFLGLPYIDLRLSFNSFVPADLDESLAGRLVDYYIDRLLTEPMLHDKVEFGIVFSCYTLDLPRRLDRLSLAGFSKKEQKIITESLRQLTNKIIHPRKGLWQEDASKLDILNRRRKVLEESNVDHLKRIYWLLEDAKRYGTLPFAGLARAGFIAIQMLRSLVDIKILSQSDYDLFISSISTISGQMADDKVILDKTTFLSKYGHLRPGTYDILSPRYDEEPDLYFDWNNKDTKSDKTKTFSLSLSKIRELAKQLKSHNLDSDPVALFDFFEAGIKLRELAKFHFTHNVSDVLSLIAECGSRWGISREDLAYCDITAFKELHVAAVNQSDVISQSIEQGKLRYQESLSIALPPLIVDPKDVWGFEFPEVAPNFITQKQITALVKGCDDRKSITGAVICIPNADPGFDWLFSYPIAGLITAWGGANSHMAIRAGELNFPAVIGVGEVLYRRWSSAKRLYIDCAGQRVEVLA